VIDSIVLSDVNKHAMSAVAYFAAVISSAVFHRDEVMPSLIGHAHPLYYGNRDSTEQRRMHVAGDLLT
jgi:hypothetical protein